jgi:hypothetical protein
MVKWLGQGNRKGLPVPYTAVSHSQCSGKRNAVEAAWAGQPQGIARTIYEEVLTLTRFCRASNDLELRGWKTFLRYVTFDISILS